MGKKPRSFTVDEEIAEELSARSDLNASGIVNEFLREYLDTSADNQAEAMVRQIKREIREIDSDIEDLEAKRSKKIEQLQEWKERRDDIHNEQKEKALEKVRNCPPDKDIASVQVAAEMLGKTPEEMVEYMKSEDIGVRY